MRIVVDPGHGGADKGGQSLGLPESHLVMLYSQDITTQLRARGYEVYMTRTADRDVDNTKRAEFANGLRAAFFLSVHANASANMTVRGPLTLYAKPSDKGRAIAEMLQMALVRVLGGRKDAVYPDVKPFVNYDYLTVLRKTDMPAVMLELGFMTNPVEIKKLESPIIRMEVAQEVARAVANLFPLPKVVHDRNDDLPNPDFIKIPTARHIEATVEQEGFKFEDVRPGLVVILRILRGMQKAGVKWAKPLADIIDEWLRATK